MELGKFEGLNISLVHDIITTKEVGHQMNTESKSSIKKFENFCSEDLKEMNKSVK